MKKELIPIYENCKSYYGKAEVLEDETKKLYSYNTLVAEIYKGKAVVYNTHSQTTLRHIKEFLTQQGFKVKSKKQILEDYGV